ncbi:MAG: hypothetical protein PHU23_17975, partial [Dehalococcoidales bacterium]|nr:hypothetical protein [Dehalococcoidales bacterium]
ELVDIFKYSGRLTIEAPIHGFGNLQFGWFGENHAVESFSDVIENKLEPVYSWFIGYGNLRLLKTSIKEIKEDLINNVLMTSEVKKLEQRLKTCKSQCYNCHLCERTFGLPDFDSLLEL